MFFIVLAVTDSVPAQSTTIDNYASVCVLSDDSQTRDWVYVTWWTESEISSLDPDHIDEMFRHDHWAIYGYPGCSAWPLTYNYEDHYWDGSDHPLFVGAYQSDTTDYDKACNYDDSFTAKSYGEIECCLVDSNEVSACVPVKECKFVNIREDNSEPGIDPDPLHSDERTQ